jgi:hypothetical protein
MQPTSTTKDAPPLVDQVSKVAGGAVVSAGGVAVKMVSMETGTRAATDAETMKRSLGSNKKLFNVADFSADLDADGSVTRDEEEIYGWLKSTADNDGDIHPKALYNLLAKFAKQRRAKRDLVKALVAALVVIVILVVTNFGVSWGVAAQFLNADKKETSEGTVMFVGENVVATAVSHTYLPLAAAAAMDQERLDTVSAISVKFIRGVMSHTRLHARAVSLTPFLVSIAAGAPGHRPLR